MISFTKSSIVFFFVAMFPWVALGQFQNQATSEVFSFGEYMAFVKKHHPTIKQAQLVLSSGEAKLLKARGAFDPKIQLDYQGKTFENTDYYKQLNSTFKIPVWYGLDLKANYETNSGKYINPENNLPEEGLYSMGVSLSLARDFFMNERMASVKQAKFYIEQTKAKRQMIVNDLLFKASHSYFEWFEAFQEKEILDNFLENATIRYQAIERSVQLGEKAAITLTEAKINMQSRQLALENAKLKLQKASLALSNFLWIDGIPMELKDGVTPVLPNTSLPNIELFESPKETINLIENHPKLRSINAKIQQIKIEQRLRRNQLLPRIDLQYNFLTNGNQDNLQFQTNNYKGLLQVEFPIFLRKERAQLKLAKYKLAETEYELDITGLEIQNKTKAVRNEIQSLNKQNELIRDMVQSYQTMLDAEERKFELGESSLFLINSREQKLINSQLKENLLRTKKWKAFTKIYHILGQAEKLGS